MLQYIHVSCITRVDSPHGGLTVDLAWQEQTTEVTSAADRNVSCVLTYRGRQLAVNMAAEEKKTFSPGRS